MKGESLNKYVLKTDLSKKMKKSKNDDEKQDRKMMEKSKGKINKKRK